MFDDADRIDDELLIRWRSGDKRAGDRLLERHYDRVRNFFANKVAEPAELTQRTFLACVESVHRYREGRSFRCYLLGIAYNVLREHFRRLYGGRDELAIVTTSIKDMGQTPSELLALDERKQLVRTALQHLPLEQQTALELHLAEEELSMREIAGVLGWPEGTVKDRLRRAKLRLHQAITALSVPAGVRPPDIPRAELGQRR